MSFLDQLYSFKASVGGDLPVAVGGVVAFLMLIVMMVVSRRRRGLALQDATLTGSNKLDHEKALNWAPPEQSFADRRCSIRREGGPVKVLLSSSVFRNGVSDGLVVDRSTTGLRIAMTIAMAPGSTMQLRALNAPDTIAFVNVVVRNCKKFGDHFEIGCEFDKTPPWNVLLLFG